MRAGAQARSIFAGLGVTGCLVAAVGAIFAVTGGVLAFTGWPSDPTVRSQPALSVAAAAHSTAPQQARALQLPAPSPGAVSATGVPGARRPTGGAHRNPGRESGTGKVTPVTPPTTPTPVPVAAGPTPAPASSPAAGLVVQTTSAVSGTVRQVGGVVPAAQPVTNSVADTVDRIGHGLVPVIHGLTGSR